MAAYCPVYAIRVGGLTANSPGILVNDIRIRVRVGCVVKGCRIRYVAGVVCPMVAMRGAVNDR